MAATVAAPVSTAPTQKPSTGSRKAGLKSGTSAGGDSSDNVRLVFSRHFMKCNAIIIVTFFNPHLLAKIVPKNSTNVKVAKLYHETILPSFRCFFEKVLMIFPFNFFDILPQKRC